MSYSFNLRSDNKSANVIRSLWSKYSPLEESPSMIALNYPPHITLAIYDAIDEEELINAFDSAVANTPQITIRFERLGYFETPNAIILWTAPTVTNAIQSLSARIHALIDPYLCRPHYRPQTWMPHCSLATTINLSRSNEAIDIANRPIEPFDVVFDFADCASFLPVEVIHERKLPAAP